MIRQLSLLLTVGLITSAQNVVFAATDPFLEKNGKLVIEVESGNFEADWSLENEIYGHTGSGYLVWRGQNNYGPSEASRGNPIAYHFEISTPGNYELRWRSRNTEGLDATEHNDSWVRFPTGENIENQHPLNGWTKAYMGHVATWTWDAYTVDHNNQNIRQYFDAGEHVVEISGRSFAHGLDRFVLYQYESDGFNAAEFNAMPESPRASQEQWAAHPFTGNSCVADSLSLSARTVLSKTSTGTTGQINQQISFNSSPQYALLKFDIPSDVNVASSLLKISNSSTESLQLSVYLGSHSDWDASTSSENLPDPATLLGTITTNGGQHTITDISIDSSMLSDEQLTLILNSENDKTHYVHGIATRSEPRLQIQTQSDYCDTYNQNRVSGTEPDGYSENPDVIDNSNNDNDGATDPQDQTDDTSDSTDTSDSVDTSVPVANENDRETDQINNPDTTSDTAAKKSGGSLSIWALLILGAFVRGIRSRCTTPIR